MVYSGARRPRTLGIWARIMMLCPGKRVGSQINVCSFVELSERRDVGSGHMSRVWISRPTAYRWINRYNETGPEGLVDRSRRPRPDRGSVQQLRFAPCLRRLERLVCGLEAFPEKRLNRFRSQHQTRGETKEQQERAKQYAVVCVNDAALLRDTWIWLLGSWLPTSGRREKNVPEFEKFTSISEAGTPIGPVEIWIPLEPFAST
jgi:hypothetical protein